MTINENLKNEVKFIKSSIHNRILAPKYDQTTTVAYFILSVVQSDNSFHQVVLKENYLICIFMNVNEIMKT